MPKGVYNRTKPAWNKGLTKETDERVKNNLDKRNSTMLIKYGDVNYNNPEKRKQTNLDKYGVENVSQVPELNKDKIEKTKQTNMIKYGTEFASQNELVKQKNRETFLRNHQGYQSSSQLPGVGDKISQKARTQEIKDKKINTFLNKYGVEYGLQSKEIMDKKLLTTLNRYGTPYYPNKEKEYQTKKKNNSFNISNQENQLYNELCLVYGKDNIERQYKDSRYPYSCDFYIKTEDLFIELNASWTHGGHPFDKNNLDDIYQLECWEEKAKTSNYYKNAIYT